MKTHDKCIALGMNFSEVKSIFKDKEPVLQCVRVSNRKGKWENY